MISVIVPIYNIENYLPKCLNSLAAQTFKDVEFILIDDGSTDRSGEIAESYSSDKRFQVFHTENRGLSAARNYGIEQSHGEYIMFVDGDDWVTPDFCRLPYRAAIENDADLIIFGRYIEKLGKIKKEKTARKKAPEGIIDTFTAFEYGRNEAWNKLYKRELFQGIGYPEGRIHEDIATTHKLIQIANKIIYLSEPLYCHVFRGDSIAHTHIEKYRRDEYISTKERYSDYNSYGYPTEKHIHYIYSAAIGYLASTVPLNDNIYTEAKTIVDSIKRIPSGLSRNRKIALISWKISKPLFYLTCIISGRIQKEDFSRNTLISISEKTEKHWR